MLCSIDVKTIDCGAYCGHMYKTLLILEIRLPFQMEGNPRLGRVNHGCRILLFLEVWPPLDGVNNDLLGRCATPPSYCKLKILSYRLIMLNEQCSC
jgi:hypothetical protein